MKLHLGVGAVYLRGYVNVDMPSPKTFLASDRPDLVERLITDEADYYRHHKNKTIKTLREGPLDQEYVVDRYGSFAFLPATLGEVDELLARHVFEHLSITEAHQALDTVKHMIPAGGLLRLDVPDHEKTLRLFQKTGDEFYIRHLLGPRRGDRGFHVLSYTRERLTTLVEIHGFSLVEEEPNIHELYPAFCLRFQRQ